MPMKVDPADIVVQARKVIASADPRRVVLCE